MNGDELARALAALRKRLSDLHTRAEPPDRNQTPPAEVVEGLHLTLEQLPVAEEGLREQNETLAAAHGALEMERQHYQALFEFAPDGSLVTNVEGIIQEANRAAGLLLNVAPHLLVGNPLVIFVAEDEHPAFHTQLSRLQAVDRLPEWEVRLQPSGAAPLDAAVTVAAVRDPAGERIALHWLLRDITARKQAEDQLRVLNRELKQRLAERTAQLEAANERKNALLISEGAARRDAEASEQCYRSLFDHNPDVVASFDLNGNFLSANPATERILGYSLEALLGHSFLPLVVPEDRERVLVGFHQVTQGTPQKTEVALAHQDGRRVEIHAAAVPIVVDDQVTEIFVTAKDITARRRAEVALHRGEQEFRALVENAPDIIARIDKELRHVYVNPAVERATGRPREAFLGRTNRELGMPEELCQLSETALRQVLSTGRESSLEFDFPTPDGIRSFQARLVPEFGTDGSVEYVFGVTRDITERRRAEEELKAHARQQAAVAQFGQRALAGVDLRTLVTDAVTCVAETLDVESSGYWELLPDGSALLLRIGRGWPDEMVGQVILDATADSQPGYTLLSGEPVIVADWRAERRFRRPALHDRGVISSLSVAIRGQDRPFGVLGAHSTSARTFTGDDIHFLQAIANVLATAIERKRAEEALRDREEQLRLTLEAANMWTWEGNLLTGDVRWSENLEAPLGLPPDTFRGTFESFLDVVHPDDRDFVVREIRRALDARTTCSTEARLLLPDGTVRWITGQGRAFYDETGRPVRVVGVGMDVTARRHSEQGLRFLVEASSLLAASLDYENRLASVARLAVSTIADYCAIDMLEDDGTVRRVEAAHRDPAKGKFVRELFRLYPPDLNGPGRISRVLRTGQPVIAPDIRPAQLEQSARNAEHLELLRELSPRSIIIVPLRARGRTLGAITFATTDSAARYGPEDLALAENLTNRVALAIDNARLYREAQEAIRARDTFLSVASHEIKTPLATIRGYAELLQRRGDFERLAAERVRRALQAIYEQTGRLDKLIDLLLDFSRLQGGQLSINWGQVDLAALTCRLVDEVRPTLERHTLAFIAPDEPLFVAGDEQRIEQVFQNLLQNAVKYSPRGGAITVRLERQDQQAHLAISDQGLGIPAQALPHLFHPFYRANNADTHHISGTGLGLFVVKEIVHLHGGEVDVESREGQGSTFIVRLPLDDSAGHTRGGRASGPGDSSHKR